MAREARGARKYVAIGGLTLACLFMVVGGTAAAGVGKTVSSAEIEDGTIQCPDFAAAVGTCPFGTGGGGGGGGGGGSSGVTQNFNSRLTANQVKSVTIGNWTFSLAATGTGACNATGTLSAGAVQGSAANANGGAFAFTVPANGSVPTAVGNSFVFSAISDDGASHMSGLPGARTQGASCLTSGFLTGV